MAEKGFIFVTIDRLYCYNNEPKERVKGGIMTTARYIRPMSFGASLGSMYKLYLKIFLPIVLINLILAFAGGSLLFTGAFVGPILLMTSNAILEKPIRAMESLKKGILSITFLKIALVSFGYLLIVGLVSMVGFGVNDSAGYIILAYVYILLTPLWIFIPMIMLLEKKGMFASIKRSFHILRKSFSRIMQVDFFIVGIFAIMALLFIGQQDYAYITLGLVFLPLLTGFLSMPYVFVYYDYRARYEDYTEELLAQELGYEAIEEMMTV
jgi:hypothetical protein